MPTDLADTGRRRILIGLGVAVAGVMWLQLLYLPHARRGAGLAKEREKLHRQVQDAQRQVQQLPQMEAKLRELAAGLSQVSVAGASGSATTRPSSEEELPGVMEKITQAARKARVKVAVLKPKGDLSQFKRDASGYTEVPLELSGSAGYHQLGVFLAALEESPELIRLSEMELKSGGQDLWTHPVQLTLRVYLSSGSSGRLALAEAPPRAPAQ